MRRVLLRITRPILYSKAKILSHRIRILPYGSSAAHQILGYYINRSSFYGNFQNSLINGDAISIKLYLKALSDNEKEKMAQNITKSVLMMGHAHLLPILKDHQCLIINLEFIEFALNKDHFSVLKFLLDENPELVLQFNDSQENLLMIAGYNFQIDMCALIIEKIYLLERYDVFFSRDNEGRDIFGLIKLREQSDRYQEVYDFFKAEEAKIKVKMEQQKKEQEQKAQEVQRL